MGVLNENNLMKTLCRFRIKNVPTFHYCSLISVYYTSTMVQVQGESVNRAILKTSWTVNAFIYLVLTHMNTIYIYIYIYIYTYIYIYIKNLDFFQFQFNPFNKHWKQKSYYPKTTSFRWPPFRSRHSVRLLRTSPIALWRICKGIPLTSCWIWCFNSWTVKGAGPLKTSDFRYP